MNIFLHYYDLKFDEAVLMVKMKTVTCKTDESKGKWWKWICGVCAEHDKQNDAG